MTLWYSNRFLDVLEIQRSHVTLHDWVRKAELQPGSTISTDQLAVDEKVIRIDGDDYWLYGAVDPETNEIAYLRLFPTTTNQTTRWFLTDLHRHYQLDGIDFLVDDAEYLVNVFDEDSYQF